MTREKKNEWFYSTGCIGRDMTYTLVSLFLLTFVQYTSGLTNAQFSVVVIVMVICRVWDAINDPMMGTIINNAKVGKRGKYRPYVLWGSIFNAVCLVGLFFLTLFSGWAYVAIFCVLYLLWGMTFTVNDVSFWSILPALGKKKETRDRITTKLAVFASVGAFIAGGITPILTTGNAVVAYRIIAVVFAVIFVGCQVMVYFCVKEPLPPKKDVEDKITLKKMFKVIFSNGQLVWMALVVLFYSLGSAILNSFGQNYFYIEFGYDGKYMLIFTVVFAIGMLISQGVYSTVAKKVKRRTITKFGLFSAIFGYAAFFVIGAVKMVAVVKLVLLCTLGMFIFLGQGIFYMNMLVQLTNTIEYDELKTGVRREAIIFSVRPFMVKLAGAIQQLLILIVLLTTNIKLITDKVASLEIDKGKGLITDIKGEASNALATITYSQKLQYLGSMCIIPIVLFIGCYLILKFKYIIDEKMYDDILFQLEEREKANN